MESAESEVELACSRRDECRSEFRSVRARITITQAPGSRDPSDSLAGRLKNERPLSIAV